ncbi:MAG: RNA 2',3'-cyclic phosphodiesterase [Variovorax sp.]|nr:RNA 2',3'-cyclic phosphodiesterase [Variovorax sp.]
MDTLFFALYPPPELARRAVEFAERLRLDLGLRAKPTDAARLHVTLHFLGAVATDAEIVAQASRAAGSVRSPPFDLTLDMLASFRARGRQRPLVLMAQRVPPDLQALHLELCEALRSHAVQADWRGLVPHLTLLRDPVAVPEQSIAPFQWTVRDFVLIRSLVGQGRHMLLGRWPLGRQ